LTTVGIKILERRYWKHGLFNYKLFIGSNPSKNIARAIVYLK
jgi:hypothetical protein